MGVGQCISGDRSTQSLSTASRGGGGVGVVFPVTVTAGKGVCAWATAAAIANSTKAAIGNVKQSLTSSLHGYAHRGLTRLSIRAFISWGEGNDPQSIPKTRPWQRGIARRRSLPGCTNTKRLVSSAVSSDVGPPIKLSPYLRLSASNSSSVRGHSDPNKRDKLRSAKTTPPVWQRAQ